MVLIMHWPLLGLGMSLLLAAGLHDVIARTIPNWAPACIAVAGLLLRIQDGDLTRAGLTAFSVFALSVLCWRAGALGGGDAKLLGAIALLLPPELTFRALACTAVLGALMAVPYIVLRGRLARPQAGRRSLGLLARTWRAERFRLRRGGPLPYGAAIALGVLLAVGSANQ